MYCVKGKALVVLALFYPLGVAQCQQHCVEWKARALFSYIPGIGLAELCKELAVFYPPGVAQCHQHCVEWEALALFYSPGVAQCQQHCVEWEALVDLGLLVV